MEVRSQTVYGLGLSNRQFTLQTGAYTMYAKSRYEGSVIDEFLGGQQGPAVHPFIMFKLDDGQFAGIYFVGSAPAQFEIVRYEGYDWTIINYVTVAGAIEAFFILPGSAEEVIRQYQMIVGLPAMPPINALGFYQGSDSYTQLSDFAAVDKKYSDQHFIVEGYNLDQWNQAGELFSLNETAFAGVKDWVASLQKDGRSLIVGLIEGIKADAKYKLFTDMQTDGALLGNAAGATLQNKLEEIYIAYPDWFAAKTESYYMSGLKEVETALSAFNGVSLQMNTNFGMCNYECYPKSEEETALLEMVQIVEERRFLAERLGASDPANEEQVGDYKSYTIYPTQDKLSIVDMPLQLGAARNSSYGNMTVSPAAVHTGVKENGQELFYHNLNGLKSAKTLHSIMTEQGNAATPAKRPFIMSDNTYAGAGAFTGSWLTQYHRTFEDLRNSIAGVMNLNMFGVALAGTEICGSLGKFDAELCARWAQSSVLFPAVRNYYKDKMYNATSEAWETNPRGEFFNMDSDADFAWLLTTGGALKQRYTLIQYIYSQLYMATKNGTPYIRPVFFSEPQSAALYADPVEDSYMAGENVHVATILEAGQKKVNSKFAQGRWISLNGFMNETMTVKEGQNSQSLDVPVGDAIVHLKEGSAIPYQPVVTGVKSTKDLLMKKSQFLVFRDTDGYAEGHMLIDDGYSVHSTTAPKNYAFWKMRVANSTVTFMFRDGDRAYTQPEGYQSQYLESIKILDAADLSGTDFACMISKGNDIVDILPVYNAGASTLELRAKDTTYLSPKDISMLRFGNSKKDVNFCRQSAAFKYVQKPGTNVTDNGSSMSVQLVNSGVATNEIVVSFAFADDDGTVKITINRDGKAVNDQTSDMIKPATVKTDKNITDVVEVNFEGAFSFVVKDSAGNIMYTGEDLLYFDPENHYVFTQAVLHTNAEVGTPVFGLGSRSSSAVLPRASQAVYTFWNSDKNVNGYHPFYIYQNTAKQFTGVFDLNTLALDYIVDTDRENGEAVFTQIATGGAVQKFIFQAATPDEVIARYQKLVGMPAVPPEWAFGWSHFQDGISAKKDWLAIQEAYVTAGVPLDALWASVDVTEDFMTLTVDNEKYPDLAATIADLGKLHIKVVPAVESGISMTDSDKNTAQKTGSSKGVFIQSLDSKAAVGAQYGNKVNYADFTAAATGDWWKSELAAYMKAQGFEGLWLTSNNLYSDCNGYCSPYDQAGVQRPLRDVENELSYVPGEERLDAHSLDLTAKYAKGTEFDLHNKYPFMQTAATQGVFTDMKKRGFIMSQSSVSGMGQYAQTYSGENQSTLEDMAASINQVLLANMYGIPFHGADVCGYYGDATADLCTRWYFLAASQPFSRNANAKGNHGQAPSDFTGSPTGSTKTYQEMI